MVTPLHVLPRKVARKKLPQRWHDHGWTTYEAAYTFFRRIVYNHFILGFQPGEVLEAKYTNILVWLISTCPGYKERFPNGVRHFTLWENGRKQKADAKYSLAAVDEHGSTHAFSLALALRAKRDPFYAAIVF